VSNQQPTKTIEQVHMMLEQQPAMAHSGSAIVHSERDLKHSTNDVFASISITPSRLVDLGTQQIILPLLSQLPP